MTYEQSNASIAPSFPPSGSDSARALGFGVFRESALCLLVSLALAPTLFACDVDENEPETSGVDFGDSDEDAGRDDGDETDAGADADGSDEDAGANDDGSEDAGASDDEELPAEGGTQEEAGTDDKEPVEPSPIRGYVVVNSDYSSSTVSVLDAEGDVLSNAVITAGAAGAGLSQPLSSDLVLPTSVIEGDELVLIDRENSVITWVDLESADVTGQLNVGPGGFVANPYDYVPYADDKAFVTRFASNGDPGQADFDEGGDVLIIDPSEREIVGRIDLTVTFDEDESAIQPRPDTALVSGGTLYVMAVGIDADFAVYGAPRLISINPETDEITDVLVIDGMRNCGELRLSPDEQLMAIGCLGDWTDPMATSGIALLDLSGSVPTLVETFGADDLAELPVSAVEFATNDLLMFRVTGSFDEDFNPVSGDQLHWLNVESGDWSESPVIETVAPYNLGELRCAQVEETCLVADAETEYGVVHLFEIEDGEVDVASQIRIDDGVGLPPRYVGKF